MEKKYNITCTYDEHTCSSEDEGKDVQSGEGG